MPTPRRPRLSWFRFYVDDFLGGVCALTAPECGRYLLLLLHQYGTKDAQCIPSDPERLRVICRGEDPGPAVLAKFTPIDGGLRNQRLASEWAAAKEEYDKKAKGGGSKDTGTDTAPESAQIPPRTPPPSKNQEPRTKIRDPGGKNLTSTDSVASAPVASKPEPWPSHKAASVWLKHYPEGKAPAQMFGALKPLVASKGWEAVEPELDAYLTSTPAKFLSWPKFAAAFGTWAKGKAVQYESSQPTGWWSERPE